MPFLLNKKEILTTQEKTLSLLSASIMQLLKKCKQIRFELIKYIIFKKHTTINIIPQIWHWNKMQFLFSFVWYISLGIYLQDLKVIKHMSSYYVNCNNQHVLYTICTPKILKNNNKTCLHCDIIFFWNFNQLVQNNYINIISKI